MSDRTKRHTAPGIRQKRDPHTKSLEAGHKQDKNVDLSQTGRRNQAIDWQLNKRKRNRAKEMGIRHLPTSDMKELLVQPEEYACVGTGHGQTRFTGRGGRHL